MSQYFPKPYEPFGRDINVKVDSSNAATKSDLKIVIHADVCNFASKTNLASLKAEVDKLDIEKLTPVPNNLAKSSNVVKNDVVKKTEYNKLVSKVDNINTTGSVLKTKYETEKSELEKKLVMQTKKFQMLLIWLKKADFKPKITKVESKIPSITGLTTDSALTVVKNKIPDVSILARKTLN